VQLPPHDDWQHVVSHLGEYRVHHPVRQLALFCALGDEAGRAQLGDSRDELVGHVRQ
jgi:hypothetical protein